MTPAIGLFLVATIIWGSSFLVVRDAVATFPAISFLAWRFVAAFAFMTPFVLRAGSRPSRAALRDGAILGAWLFLGFLGQALGLRTTTASNAAFFHSVYVVLTPIGAWLYLRRRPSARVAGAVALAAVGLVLLTGASPREARAGDLLNFASGVAFTVHIVIGERLAARHPAMTLNAVQFAVVAALSLAGAAAFEGLPLPGASMFPALAYTSIVCTVAALFAWTYAQARLPSHTVALISVLEAPFAALFGVFLGGERMTAPALVGAALLFAACLVVGLRARH